MSGYRDIAYELGDGNSLVSLFHIELVHILVDLDGIADSLFRGRVVKRSPFHGKFAGAVDERHEVTGESILPSDSFGAGDHIQGDFFDSQFSDRQLIYILYHRIERGKIGILS